MKRIGTTDPNTCAYNDLALVKVDAADVAKVNPSVPFWGGPTGIDTDGTAAGDRVYTYGNSSLRGGVEPLSPHTGISLGDDAADGGWTPPALHRDPRHPRRLGLGVPVRRTARPSARCPPSAWPRCRRRTTSATWPRSWRSRSRTPASPACSWCTAPSPSTRPLTPSRLTRRRPAPRGTGRRRVRPGFAIIGRGPRGVRRAGALRGRARSRRGRVTTYGAIAEHRRSSAGPRSGRPGDVAVRRPGALVARRPGRRVAAAEPRRRGARRLPRGGHAAAPLGPGRHAAGVLAAGGGERQRPGGVAVGGGCLGVR